MSTPCIGRILWAFAFLVFIFQSTSASAFTFSDGIEEVCTTSDGVVRERHFPPGDPMAPGGFIGFTHFDPEGGGWIIDWNDLMLSSVPLYVHDFVFFHECAHAKTRTLDEVKANCLGLLDMRAAGRAGTKIEAKLAAYHKKLGYMGTQYGLANAFWAETLVCADSATGRRRGA